MRSFFLSINVLLLLLIAVAAGAVEPDRLSKARDHLAQGRLQAAVIELKNALQQTPDAPEARFLLGKVYLEAGQGANAEKELRRARQLGSYPAAVLVPLLEAYLLQGEFERLLDETEPGPLRSIEGLSEPQRAEVHALRGFAHLGRRQPEQAQQAFQTALALQPEQVRALLGQARLALVGREPQRARALVERALVTDSESAPAWDLLGDVERLQSNPEAAAQAYGKAMEHSFSHAAVQLKRALMRIALKDYAGAEADIRAVAELVKDAPDVLYAEGLLHFHQGRYDEAQNALERVLARQSDNLSAVFYQGAAHYAQGHMEQAEHDLSRFLRAFPQSDQAARMLAAARYRLGDYAGAEQALAPVLARSSEETLLLNLMAGIKRAQGELQAASEYLERAAAAEPGSAVARARLGWNLLQQGEDEEALRALEQAVELNPELRQADVALIIGYLRAGEFDAALEAARRLQAKWPDNAVPWSLIGMAQRGQGQAEAARQAFAKALEIEPGAPSATANLAAMALAEDNPDEARRQYLESLKHYPDRLDVLLRLALLEAREGNQEAYVARLEEALIKSPQALQPRVLLARYHLYHRDPLKALATLGQVEAAQHGHPAYLTVLGAAQLAAGEPGNAEKTFTRLVEQQPDSVHARYLLASAYGENENYAGLRQQVLEGLKLRPDYPYFASLIARLVSASPKDAGRLLQDLQVAHPEHPYTVDLEGRLAVQEGRLSGAVAVYRQARQRQPDNPGWVLRLAQTQWQALDQEGSVATLEEWLRDHPEDAQARAMLAAYYVERGQDDQARSAYAALAEQAPGNVVVLNNLAWLLRKENPKQALAYAEQALAASRDGRVLDTVATILLEQGENARALELLREATEKLPQEPSVGYHLALALARSGDKTAARTILQEVLGGNQAFPEREEAQSLLAELTP